MDNERGDAHAGGRDAAPPRATHPMRATALSIGVIVVALVAILVIPTINARRTQGLRSLISDVSEPARGQITRIHLSLATGESMLRDYQELRDSSLRVGYETEVAKLRDASARLDPLATRLGPAVDDRLDSLTVMLAAWHASSDALLQRPGGAGARARDSLHQDVYVGTLVAAARLDEAIRVSSQRVRASIDDADRRDVWLTVTLSVLALCGVVATVWLGARLHRYAAEAERGRVELQRLMETKARFTRGLTHDLKNPLGAIDGHAQLLELGVHGPLNERQAASVARIRGSVRSLLAFITDLLQLSAAESGELRIERSPSDVAALVAEVAEEHRASATAAGLDLEVDASPSLPLVSTDPRRLRQIVGNLLSNAVKYTPPGGRVAVHVAQRHDGGEAGDRLCVTVSDDGPGIPPDARERVFTEFTRLDATAAKPGAGLGLAISRRVARMLGGDVRAEDGDGTGARFVLELPLSR